MSLESQRLLGQARLEYYDAIRARSEANIWHARRVREAGERLRLAMLEARNDD